MAEYNPILHELRLAHQTNKTTVSVVRSNMGASLTGTAKWDGGVLGPNGKIYVIPQDSTDILIIDTVTGTATRSNMGATITGSGKWSSGILATNGKLYGIPRDSVDILIISNSVNSKLPRTVTLSPYLNKF